MTSSSGAIRAGRAFVELFADNTRLQQGLRLAETQIKEFGAKVSTMGKQVATISLLPLIPAGIGTKIFAGFDDQMRAVQAVTGSTGEAFDQLTEKAKFLGRTTSFTAQQVASGMLELGRAGFKSNEIDASIASVMDLARSTQTEIPRATEIAGNALRGFGLDASEMTRVSDVLTTTANNSAQTLDDLGEAFKYVAPIADAAGMSLEETAKVLGTLANFGIKGSLAGTAVKNILTRMADPDIQAKYEQLGVHVKDAEGNLRNMADVLKEVGMATANLPNAEKLAIFKELFDMRALAGGAKLTSESFENLCNAIDNASGESARVAKTMDEGIGGAFRMFLSAAEGMAIAIGTALAPEIKRISDYLTVQQTAFTEWINLHKETIISVTKLGAKILILGAGLYAVGTAASAVASIIALFRGTLIATRVIVSILSTDITKFGKIFTNFGSLFKPIDPIKTTVDTKSAASLKTLGLSASEASGAVTQLNAALSAMRATALNTSQAVTSLLTSVSQLLSTIRPIAASFGQATKSSTLFSKSIQTATASVQKFAAAGVAPACQNINTLVACLGNATGIHKGYSAALSDNGKIITGLAASGKSLNSVITALTLTFAQCAKSIITCTTAMTGYNTAQTQTQSSQTVSAAATTAFTSALTVLTGTIQTLMAQTAVLTSAQQTALTVYTQGSRIMTAANATALISFRALAQSIAQAAVALLAYSQAQRATAVNMTPLLAAGRDYSLALTQGTVALSANTNAMNARLTALTGTTRAEQLLTATTQSGTLILARQNAVATTSAGALTVAASAATNVAKSTVLASTASATLGKTWSALCAVPVAGWLGAITLGAYAAITAFKSMGKHVAELTNKYEGLVAVKLQSEQTAPQKQEEARDDLGKYKRLEELSQKPNLTASEMEEAKNLVTELESAYGSFGAQVDDTAKSIKLLGNSFETLVAAMGKKQLADVNNRIGELKRNASEIKKEQDHLQSYWGNYNMQSVYQHWVDPEYKTDNQKRSDELQEKSLGINAELNELEKLKNNLESGNTDAILKNATGNEEPASSTSATFDLNEFEEKLRNTNATGNSTTGTAQQSDILALQTGYQQAIAQIQSQIANATTQEEKDAGSARLANLDKMFTAKMAKLTAALPENKAQADFWDKIKDNGMSAEEKEIAQLNKDLTTVLEAIKAEVAGAVNNTPNGETPHVTISADELATAYKPELEVVSAKSDDAESLIGKATSGEYTDPEEFTKDSAAVIDNLDKTLEGINPGPEREKLATAIEALKVFCETFAKTIGKADHKTKVDAFTGSGIKQKAAQNATHTQIQGVRDKYTQERQQKMKDTEIEDLPLTQAAQNRDEKKMALETAKAGGDKKQIAKAQLEYDQARNTYDEAERNKHQTDLDNSAQEMQTALDDYTNAGNNTEKREDAKKRYDEAKSKHDSAQSYFDEKGSAQSQQLSLDTSKAKANRDEKRIALDDAIESGDRTQVAQAKKEYNTAQTEYQKAQYKQNLATSTQTADQNLEATSATFAEKKFNLQQAQTTGDPALIEQAQSEYNEADYARKQAEYQKALADAQNSAQEVSDAEENLKNIMKNGTPEEKAAAKERLKEAKVNQKDALKRLRSFDTAKTVRQASPDYSNPQSNERDDKTQREKPENRDAAVGTFDAFEALGQNYDWQKTNGEKQLTTLVDIRSLLEQQDGTYI